MQIDYEIIKRILNAMQKRESHFVAVSKLLEASKPDYQEITPEEYADLFFGHLQLLKDNEVITEVLGENLGVRYTISGNLTLSGCYIRLTSKGYDFIKLLNKEGLPEKLKRLTINESLKIAETVIANGISDYLGKLF